MSLRLAKFISVLVLIATSISVVSTKAIADTDTDPDSSPAIVETLPEVFERAFFKDSKDFYQNTTQRRQTHFLFGPYRGTGATFPDLELVRDAKRINIIYRDALEQQNTSDPTIRTLDLPNPYETSLRQQPSTRISTPVVAPTVGTELVPERPPAAVRGRY